jgi:hypothetical protein
MRKAVLTLCVFGLTATGGVEAESVSKSLARELTQTMQQQKMDAVAANDPAEPGRFVAALLFPGQLLVVSARHAADASLAEQVARKAYRDVYTTLHGSPIPETKFFVQDLGADGLDSDGKSIDVVYERAVDQIIFDGQPENHKMSKRAYAEKFQRADDSYSQCLRLLLDAARQTAPALAGRP